MPATFDAVDDAIDANADIAEAMLTGGLSMFGISPSDRSWHGKATPKDLDKVRVTIRQLYRDWSASGSSERRQSYSPFLDALEQYSPCTVPERHRQKILVPGAGLGRLVFDLCLAGYTVEGNEISYHQLIASNYMLNHTECANQFKLYPWALHFSNHISRATQLSSVGVPDIHPATEVQAAAELHPSPVPFSERMSMTAGDFCEIYQRRMYARAISAVATCFFIDTASNVINYITTVHHCLEPGGLWINLGPLLWHSEPTVPHSHNGAGSRGDVHTSSISSIDGFGSVELTHDEMIALVERFGFVIEERRDSDIQSAGYIQDPASMLQSTYRPVMWVARKR